MNELNSAWDFETTSSGMVGFLTALVRTIRGASPPSRQVFLRQFEQEIEKLVEAEESWTLDDAADIRTIYNRVRWNVERRL